MSSGRIIESHGRESLLDTAEALMRSEGYDIAIVRRFVEPEDSILLRLEDGSDERGADNSEELIGRFPNLVLLGEAIIKFWDEIGVFPNMSVGVEPNLDLLRLTGMEHHFDEPITASRINAGVQLSLCLRGNRTVYAERVHDVPGGVEFSKKSYDDLIDMLYSNRGDRSISRPEPRTAVVANSGDLVIFPQNPVIAYHGVRQVPGESAARLINYYASLRSD